LAAVSFKGGDAITTITYFRDVSVEIEWYEGRGLI
jgi:hypothetical protein